MDELRRLPAVPDIPFEQMQDADQLYYLARQGRMKMLAILNLTPEDLQGDRDDKLAAMRLYRIQADVAQSLQTIQVKVDETSLQHVEHTDLLDVIREKMKNIKLPSKGG
jgi:hypothetical protein